MPCSSLSYDSKNKNIFTFAKTTIYFVYISILIFMQHTLYTYNHSFEIELERCNTCGAYYNINPDKSKHTCSNTSIQSIDVLEQMIENTKPKQKIRKNQK